MFVLLSGCTKNERLTTNRNKVIQNPSAISYTDGYGGNFMRFISKSFVDDWYGSCARFVRSTANADYCKGGGIDSEFVYWGEVCRVVDGYRFKNYLERTYKNKCFEIKLEEMRGGCRKAYHRPCKN